MKKFIRFLVTNFASREFAFIYCIIGTLAQTSHTYYLIESISSLSGWGKQLQAIGLSVFISSSLLFFTAIADAESESKEHKRIHFAVNLFMVIEILINSYYYVSHLLIKDSRVFDSIFALLVSCLIPVTIKLYAGVIQVRKWADVDGESKTQRIDESVDVDETTPKLETSIVPIETSTSDGVVIDTVTSGHDTRGEAPDVIKEEPPVAAQNKELAESLNDALDEALQSEFGEDVYENPEVHTTPVESGNEPPTVRQQEPPTVRGNELPQLTGNFSSIKI